LHINDIQLILKYPQRWYSVFVQLDY